MREARKEKKRKVTTGLRKNSSFNNRDPYDTSDSEFYSSDSSDEDIMTSIKNEIQKKQDEMDGIIEAETLNKRRGSNDESGIIVQPNYSLEKLQKKKDNAAVRFTAFADDILKEKINKSDSDDKSANINDENQDKENQPADDENLRTCGICMEDDIELTEITRCQANRG